MVAVLVVVILVALLIVSKMIDCDCLNDCDHQPDVVIVVFYHDKTNNKREVINITMYHSQRERTQGYRAPIANGT